MKKLLISESQLEIYLRDNPLGTTDASQAKNAIEEPVKNLEKLVSQDKPGKVNLSWFINSFSSLELLVALSGLGLLH